MLVKTREIALQENVDESTVRLWARKAWIAPAKILPGGSRLFDPEAVRHALQEHQVKVQRYKQARRKPTQSSDVWGSPALRLVGWDDDESGEILATLPPMPAEPQSLDDLNERFGGRVPSLESFIYARDR